MPKSRNAGAKNSHHKLTFEEVVLIKEYFIRPKRKRKRTMRQVANYLGVSIWTIKDIAYGRTWLDSQASQNDPTFADSGSQNDPTFGNGTNEEEIVSVEYGDFSMPP